MNPARGHILGFPNQIMVLLTFKPILVKFVATRACSGNSDLQTCRTSTASGGILCDGFDGRRNSLR
jgi:hypothetical protein